MLYFVKEEEYKEFYQKLLKLNQKIEKVVKQKENKYACIYNEYMQPLNGFDSSNLQELWESYKDKEVLSSLYLNWYTLYRSMKPIKFYYSGPCMNLLIEENYRILKAIYHCYQDVVEEVHTCDELSSSIVFNYIPIFEFMNHCAVGLGDVSKMEDSSMLNATEYEIGQAYHSYEEILMTALQQNWSYADFMYVIKLFIKVHVTMKNEVNHLYSKMLQKMKSEDFRLATITDDLVKRKVIS